MVQKWSAFFVRRKTRHSLEIRAWKWGWRQAPIPRCHRVFSIRLGRVMLTTDDQQKASFQACDCGVRGTGGLT